MILNAVSVFFIWFVSSPTGSIVMSCVFTALSRLSGDVAHLVNAELFPTKIRYGSFMDLILKIIK